MAGGKFKQSFEVGLALLRESDDFEIDDLFAGQADAGDEPGDCGMKPEGGVKNFFRQVMGPIVTANVKQFVAGNRGLELGVHRGETFWKKNDRRRKPKVTGESTAEERRNSALVFTRARMASRTAADSGIRGDGRGGLAGTCGGAEVPLRGLRNETAIPARIMTAKIWATDSRLGKCQ